MKLGLVGRAPAAYDDAFMARMASAYLAQTPWTRLRLAAVRDLVEPAPGDRVLDLGSAGGAVTHFLSTFGCDVVGIDPEERAVDLAASLFPSLRFEVGDATALRFEDASFDKVVAADLVEHLDDGQLAALLAEARRVLVAGGTLSIYTPNQRHPVEWLKERDLILARNETHVGLRDAPALEAALGAGGLRGRALGLAAELPPGTANARAPRRRARAGAPVSPLPARPKARVARRGSRPGRAPPSSARSRPEGGRARRSRARRRPPAAGASAADVPARAWRPSRTDRGSTVAGVSAVRRELRASTEAGGARALARARADGRPTTVRTRGLDGRGARSLALADTVRRRRRDGLGHRRGSARRRDRRVLDRRASSTGGLASDPSSPAGAGPDGAGALGSGAGGGRTEGRNAPGGARAGRRSPRPARPREPRGARTARRARACPTSRSSRSWIPPGTSVAPPHGERAEVQERHGVAVGA